MPTLGDMPGVGYTQGQNAEADEQAGERGYRRKKLAAMAGSIYRSGQQAVTEIRDQYAQTRVIEADGRPHIPGAFPDVAIVSQGDGQMVLFPSYAKRHVKKDRNQMHENESDQPHGGLRDEDYWRQEWERNEDEKAIVDVDVRGWLYSPSVGPLTRRNRMLLGMARHLSGVSARSEQQGNDGSSTPPTTEHQRHEAEREQRRIEAEAARLEKQGQKEKYAAYQGRYSETPQKTTDPETGSLRAYEPARRGSAGSVSLPPSPTQSATQYATAAGEMTEAELALANTNLMARIAPFMTNPMVSMPVTVFFYNDEKSQSRSVMTNDAGHFILRAALEFIPTHVRVLTNENLSAIQEVLVTEPYGVSLISDVDDTIKRSNISGGAREIFRNTFVRDLNDLTVDGVKEWYSEMHSLGVSIHYCSNSPWQLYPVLASYFKIVGLPPGSLHLKQYTGMLQGIFEPVAERKKSTLDRLLRDFPERKFILVGDSGEADLEVYTDLAVQNPGRILAVFIRDVTSPEQAGFFDPAFNMPQRKAANSMSNSGQTSSQNSVQRQNAPPQKEKPSSGPVMGDLIDFSEDPQGKKVNDSSALEQVMNASGMKRKPTPAESFDSRKTPPPRPSKPVSLRSSSSLGDGTVAPPLPTRKTVGAGSHPLSKIQNASQQTISSIQSDSLKLDATQSSNPTSDRNAPPPPPPRRRTTQGNTQGASASATARDQSFANSDVDYNPLPPSAAPLQAHPRVTRPASLRSPWTSPSSSPRLGAAAQVGNKKTELWNRRLQRAHEQLHGLGVQLYTWRKGHDVIEEAVGLVRQANRDMERKRQSRR